MAILELDKISLSKPDTGIKCMHCGGDLQKTTKINLTGKIITWLTLMRRKSRHYECENCKKKYTIL